MLQRHQPRRLPRGSWHYPALSDVLDKCELANVSEYIRRLWQTIAAFVVDCPLLLACWGGEQKLGSPHRQWWWEQKMDLGSDPRDSVGKLDGSLSSASSSASVGDVTGG